MRYNGRDNHKGIAYRHQRKAFCRVGHKGRPYYTLKRRERPVYSRDDPCGRPGCLIDW